ncbi:tetratricopeptide repeat protein [bacterium]|nr:tetratricopeptide repeat protein [bacterium]
MAYSKMRGPRKPKKEKVVEEIVEHDAFQEQGAKFFETLTEHPWFVGGTVLAIIAITAISLGIASIIKSSNDADADVYSHGLQAWAAFQTESKDDAAAKEKSLQNIIEKFKVSADELAGTVEGDASYLYIGKAYYLLSKCDDAVKNFQKVQTSSLSKELRFGAYEGEAFCAYDGGKFDDAIKVWQKYLDSTTSDFYKDYALFYIGTSYEKLGNNEKAIEFFTTLKNSYPKSLLNAKIISKLPEEKKAPVTTKIIKQTS